MQHRKYLAMWLIVLGSLYGTLCLLLWLSQRALIYFPTDRGAPTPMFTLQVDDAELVISTNAQKSDHAVIYFGGNAEDVSHAIDLLSHAFPDSAVFAMHYRGYGGSTGAPSEWALVGDAQQLYEHVNRSHKDISIIGRSLGSGVAVQVAAAKTLKRLVLITPFYSLVDVASERFPIFPVPLILQDHFASWQYAPQISAPTTIIVAANDQLIPWQHSEKLANAFPAGIAKLLTIEHADHNDIAHFPEYLAALNSNRTHTNP